MSALGVDIDGNYYTRVLNAIHECIPLCQNTVNSPHFGCMARKFTFKELLEAAARSHASLWTSDGRLNLGAVARYYEAKGYPVTQPTLHRTCKGQTRPREETLEATYQVFGIPKHLLRGEPASAEMEELLSHYPISTILLAKRLESLPKEAYHAIAEQIEIMLAKEQQIKNAIESATNVTPIDRTRRKV